MAKSSFVSLYLDDVIVRFEKSATVIDDNPVSPLERMVTVVLLRGLACATTTRPRAFLMVAVSHSFVCSEL